MFFTLGFIALINNSLLSSINFLNKFTLASLLLLATSLPLTIGGWGLREIVIYLYPNLSPNDVDTLLPIIFFTGFLIPLANTLLFLLVKSFNLFKKRKIN